MTSMLQGGNYRLHQHMGISAAFTGKVPKVIV